MFSVLLPTLPYEQSPTLCVCFVSGNQSFGLIQISEAMDIRTRQGLLNALAGKAGKRMDSLLVPLELLCCVSRTEFSDKKAFLRWQKRQVKTTFPLVVVMSFI